MHNDPHAQSCEAKVPDSRKKLVTYKALRYKKVN